MEQRTANILIVEDNPSDVGIIRRQLAKHHFHLDFAASGEEALKSLKEKMYDIVVTDYSMPGMSGLHVLDGIKRAGYDIPVVIMTGAGSEKIAVEAMKKGASDYLIKSFDPSWLEVFPSVIQNNIEKYRITKEKEKIEEEKRELLSQLRQAQKMESIGTLAGGIAHDFNNLLMGIIGHTSLMLLHTDSEHPNFEHLKGIENTVERGKDLARQLLNFARGGKYDVKPTDINELIDKSSEMFGRTKKQIRLHKKYQKDIWPVEVDRGQIEQALLNLYVNAWQAMPLGGDICIETSHVVLDENYTKPFGVKPGNYVKICVTDTGVGMDEAIQQRIFEPFFSTKKKDHGAGLGLASAYGIIKNHDGITNVSSKKGEGSTFTIYLPASDKQVAIKEKKPADEMLKGTETILLVDDESIVLDITKKMLEEIGYNVMVAGSGKEALKIYGRCKDKIDLVILDMVMPEMGGGETYDRMKDLNPEVSVLLSTGYSMDTLVQEILDRGCDSFIQKPFTVKELSRKMREILDGQ